MLLLPTNTKSFNVTLRKPYSTDVLVGLCFLSAGNVEWCPLLFIFSIAEGMPDFRLFLNWYFSTLWSLSFCVFCLYPLNCFFFYFSLSGNL